MKRTLRRMVNGILGRFGYVVRSLRDDQTSQEAALARCKSRGLAVHTLIDVGASDGRWSEDYLRIFPGTYCFMIEANAIHEPGLKAFTRQYPASDYVLAVAASGRGTLAFVPRRPFSGMAYIDAPENADYLVQLPSTSIDLEIAERRLQPPFAIKLDTAGFEVPILEGAKEALKDTHLLVIETYNFRLRDGVLRFHEMVDYLEDRGLRCVDLCCPLFRLGDRALWQVDLLFIPDTHPVFARNSYWLA